MEIRVSNQNFNEEILCSKVFEGEVNGHLTLIVDNGFAAEIFVNGASYDTYGADKHDLGRRLNRKSIQVYAKKANDTTIYFGMRVPNKCILNGAYVVSIISFTRIRNIDMFTSNQITIENVRDAFNSKIQKIMEKCDLVINDTADAIGKYIASNIAEELSNNGLQIKTLVVNHFEKIN